MANANENEHAPKRAKATGDLFTMMQVCREAAMTYQTLKFYCNQGLVPNVKRDKNNRRVFDKRDVEWVKSLICLKRCGMSIEEMKEYLALCLQGETSIPQRKTMLAEKRSRLVEQIAELEASVEYIDWKQGFYDDVLAGRTEYFSNLLPEK
jgi:DNA-binding transcriptional MerR regulator